MVRLQYVNAVIFAVWVCREVPCDDGMEHRWCFLSCVFQMSGPMSKSTSIVNTELL